MKSETAMARAIEFTETFKRSTEPQREEMRAVWRSYFNNINQCGESDSIPLPNENETALFWFHSGQRGSLKTVSLILCDNWFLPFLSANFQSIRWDKRVYSFETSSVFYNKVFEKFNETDETVLNKLVMEMDDDELEELLERKTSGIREFASIKKRTLNRVFYARRCPLKLSTLSPFDLDADVMRLRDYELSWDAKDRVKAFFDSPDIERRKLSIGLIKFTNGALSLTMRGRSKAKNKDMLTRTVLSWFLGGCPVNHARFYVETAPEYLANSKLPHVHELERVLDVRTRTMTVHMTSARENFIQRVQRKLGVTPHADSHRRLARLLLANSTPMIDLPSLVSMRGTELASNGVEWASPVWDGVRTARVGIPAFLEYASGNLPK